MGDSGKKEEPTSNEMILFSLEVRTRQDMVLARQRTTQIAERLGLSKLQQVQLASAVAEISRSTLEHGAGGLIEFRVGGGQTPRLLIAVRDDEAGLPEDPSEVEGFSSARRLMDHFAIESDPEQGTTIVLGQQLPSSQDLPDGQDLAEIVQEVSEREPATPIEELQRQNQQLLSTLDRLQLKAEEWQTTFDAIPDALCLMDGEGRILQVNQTMSGFLDRTPEAVAGRTWSEVSPDQATIDDLLGRARETRCRSSKDLNLHHRWYRLQVDILLGEAGEAQRFILLIMDITEERQVHEQVVQSESRLRALVGHSRVGLWLIPATTVDAQEVRLAECSPDLERFLGLSRDKLHGMAFAELLHPDDQEQDQKLRADLLAGKTEFYEIELRFVHKSDAPIWGHVAVSTIKDSTGRIVYLVYTIVDITRRKQMELRLTQINETLKAFAHTVSHDLKGPLSGAITANQVLRKLLQQPLTDSSKLKIMELTDIFSASVSRSIDLINELLALAEAGWEGGGATLMDVAEVIERVLEDNAEMIKERGVRIELEDGLGQVPMAPAHLYQVFGNLIGNAIRHNSSPTPTISIARIDEAHQDVHRFTVRDNGPGIPEDLQDRLFDPFVRRTGGGSGLGLATVKRIVQIYGGTIRAYNDGGACFDLSVRNLVC